MFLKQSTAVTVSIGPFVDQTDGFTAETGLTISQADVRLSKNGGAYAQKGDATTCTHQENGYYSCPLNTTDTATAGILRLAVNESGALQVFEYYMVLPAAAYDALVSTGKFGIDLANVGSYAAGPFAPTGIIDSGTAQSATGTTLVLRAAAAFADSELVGATVVIRSATTGAGQRRLINASVGSTDTVTVDAWTTTPTGTIIYDIYGSAPASASSPPAVNATQFAGQTITAAAGVTLPSSVASPTNITAGVITTVTNLTNDPPGVTTLLSRLSSARAGFLDFLDAAISSRSTFAGGAVASVTAPVAVSASGLDAALDTANGVETGLSLRGALRLMAAVLFGKASGLATATAVFRNAVADAKSRVTATTDVDGNRTAVTTDQT